MSTMNNLIRLSHLCRERPFLLLRSQHQSIRSFYNSDNILSFQSTAQNACRIIIVF
ncbi:hypothetical protein DERP_000806 [Dermatophagoides pteronyssinus]|uniref:Uncharacterized protein n=1 Tax=Dermatophagoides pteronyssinus TaxID=6956 RepID=A0ABQ8J1D4_DERPT|nr:hypothetical protein DERP_000806 [Dermatophagoides pteronyssinus]